jgi:hypothetical protein
MVMDCRWTTGKRGDFMNIVYTIGNETWTGQYKRLIPAYRGPDRNYPDGFMHEIALDNPPKSNPSGTVILSTPTLAARQENEAVLIALGVIDAGPARPKESPLQAVNAWIAKHNGGQVPPAPAA